MSQGESRPDKLDVAQALLVRGSVYVYVDPRSEGVRVPAWLTKQPQLVLQFGLDLPVPIPDMRLDDEGVSGTLSFNRQPFPCFLPWSAVFALVGDDGMGMVFEDELPVEIADEVEAGFRKKRASRPALRSIEGGREQADGDSSSDDPSARPALASVPPAAAALEAAPDEATSEETDGDSSSDVPSARPALASVPPAAVVLEAVLDEATSELPPNEPADSEPPANEPADGDEPPTPPDSTDTASATPRRGHLRLIK